MLNEHEMAEAYQDACDSEEFHLNKKTKPTWNDDINGTVGGELDRLVADELEKVNDSVYQPKHYELMDGIESIEVIACSLTGDEWRGFCLGNALKYRLRVGKKDNIEQELKKADNYTNNLYHDFKHLNRGYR